MQGGAQALCSTLCLLIERVWKMELIESVCSVDYTGSLISLCGWPNLGNSLPVGARLQLVTFSLPPFNNNSLNQVPGLYSVTQKHALFYNINSSSFVSNCPIHISQLATLAWSFNPTKPTRTYLPNTLPTRKLATYHSNIFSTSPRSDPHQLDQLSGALSPHAVTLSGGLEHFFNSPSRWRGRQSPDYSLRLKVDCSARLANPPRRYQIQPRRSAASRCSARWMYGVSTCPISTGNDQHTLSLQWPYGVPYMRCKSNFA